MKRSIAIFKLRAGLPLILLHNNDGDYFYLGEYCLPGNQARTLISDLGLVEGNDTLFEGIKPQTWRLP